ncbi:MAG: F0F1 ATP synthase subunit alpha [Candidatus Paceibacterota bacterium]|jgi:F-type H+-transporting ATPase subunit alpha
MEILDYLKKEIENLDFNANQEEVGQVIEVKDGTAKISGLLNVTSMEIIKFEGKEEVLGIALSLEETEVGAIILGEDSKVRQGDVVKRTGKVVSVPVGEAMIGRVIDPLGRPLDGKGKIETKEFGLLEKIGPSVIEREPVDYPLHTGIKIIDSLIPIGRGQRELLLGDRISTKSSVAIDVILNQKTEARRPICIYVAIGQKRSKIARTIEILEKSGAMEYTIVVVAASADPASFWYLAPYCGAAQGEYFMNAGKDALIVYDDLTKHAWAWREVALILRRPPGREAYPGDIFYLHSRLLERAARMSKEKGGGSLTALPIIETQAGDITAYVPTNVISITDGQLFFDSGLYLKGQRPEINVGLSVSRVGSAAQTKAMKKIASTLKLELAQFKELEAFLEFAEEVDQETRNKIERGQRMMMLLRQEEREPMPFEKEVLSVFVAEKGLFDKIKLSDIKQAEKDIIDYFELMKPEVLKNIKASRELSPEVILELEKGAREALKKYEI